MDREVKSFIIIENANFDVSLQLPYKFLESYIIHDYIKGNYLFKEQIQEWVKKNCNHIGRLIIVEVEQRIDQSQMFTIWSTVRFFATILRLVKYNSLFLRYMLNIENGRVGGTLSDEELKPAPPLKEDSFICTEDLKKAESIILVCNKMFFEKKKNQRIYTALHFWDSSISSGTFERRTIELFTALEGIFTTDNSEVTYKLSNRISWFLYPNDAEKRISVFKNVKDGYKLRSKVVHGLKFVDLPDLDLINNIHSWAKDVIIKILSDQKLINIFTSSNNKLDEYFNYLVHGADYFTENNNGCQ